MRRAPAVSRPAWAMALSGVSGSGRRSPVEIVANAASYVTRTPVADRSGLRAGPFGRWTDGVAALRGDCVAFASHWQAHNYRILTEAGPLWAVLGDSTGQGLGAPSPEGGYVGQVLAELRLRTGRPWRVLNLSVSGALTRDVLHDQLPRLPVTPDLVTCGIGANDILYTAPGKLLRDLRTLVGAVPDHTVVLDLPLPTGLWGILGPDQRALRGADQPDHPRGGPGPRPAGRGDLRPFPAAVAREVRVRLLPPQPGRLPRLDPRPAGRHPARGRRRSPRPGTCAQPGRHVAPAGRGTTATQRDGITERPAGSAWPGAGNCSRSAPVRP